MLKPPWLILPNDCWSIVAWDESCVSGLNLIPGEVGLEYGAFYIVYLWSEESIYCYDIYEQP